MIRALDTLWACRWMLAAVGFGAGLIVAAWPFYEDDWLAAALVIGGLGLVGYGLARLLLTWARAR